MTPVFARWLLICVRRAAHDFDENGVCRDCTAKRGGPTLADILAENPPKKPS